MVYRIRANPNLLGIKLLGNPRLHKIERVCWILIILAAAGYAIFLIRTNWTHFSDHPTVVSIKKDFRNWENAFPAATACFLNRVDDDKASQLIRRLWNVSSTHPKYLYYLDFIQILANISFENMFALKKFGNDPSLNRVDMTEIVTQVHPDIRGTLVTFQTESRTEWQLVLTEIGLCFTVNSKFAWLLSPNDTLHSHKYANILHCPYLNGLCYARYDSDPTLPLNYYIHSNLDIIHATTESPLTVFESEELEVNYELMETTSSPNIRYLTPFQRKCRFDDEPITKNVPVYSSTVCYTICRYQLAMNRCGCKPFFYIFLEGKICDIDGLICLARYSNLFKAAITKNECQCPQPCHHILYLKESSKLTRWQTSYFEQRITFRWGLLPPNTKYHRDILFGFQGLIVSFGGILSLFLGMSFITLIETTVSIAEWLYGGTIYIINHFM
ncbi:sodium channel protein Nach-like [Cylas formicarius]|uniref:sodium channel protein Nach-like n=1 Tax=Cylas formicarius TaxID=197179 RepID=UPI00295863A0|nr:sodium channel protein Nach-like [Cylas formicarius]